MSNERPDPDKVTAAMERVSLDNARQYDDRKTLACQVNWQADEIKRLRADVDGYGSAFDTQDKEIERLRAALRTCAAKGDIVVYEFAKQALGEAASA